MWTKIPDLRGVRAAKSWLRRVAPDRQERVRRNYDQSMRGLKRALGQDRDLLRSFENVLEEARFFGRVDGLREGLDLYEYGTRMQNDNSAPFQAVMNYIARCANQYDCTNEDEKERLAAEISTKHVCEYLDKEIARIKSQETEIMKMNLRIEPPWKGCNTWKDALKKRKNNVARFVSKAKSEALSERYCTLMAWKTWCREGKTQERTSKNSETGASASHVNDKIESELIDSSLL
jgi:hypothetical protein